MNRRPRLAAIAAFLLGMASFPPLLSAKASPAGTAGAVFENARVRVFRTAGPEAGSDHPTAVLVQLEEGGGRKPGDAIWARDARAGSDIASGTFFLVEPIASATAPPAPKDAVKPGQVPSTGMSMRTILEDARMSVARARMEVGAQEGFHTHAADLVVLYLSGGSIEDTAGGKTEVRHWKPGDVEFEARGSSHSARNVGAAIDVVLVVLKP